MCFEVITDPIASSIKNYETLWAALVGFAGVIIALVYNNNQQLNLQARQKKHEMEMQAAQIAHETNSLRVALKSELVSVKSSYESNISSFREESGANSALYPNSAFHIVFDTLLEKLGLLSEEEIATVIKAYRLISELPYKLRMLVGAENVGGYNDDYIIVRRDVMEVAAGLHEVILPDIDGAIQELDQYLSAPI